MGLRKRTSEGVKRIFQRLRRKKSSPPAKIHAISSPLLPTQKNAQSSVRIELRRLATYLPGAAKLHTHLLRAPHFYPNYKTVPHITGDLHIDQRLTRLSVDLHARMQRASDFRLKATGATTLQDCRRSLAAARREEEQISTLKEKTQKLLMTHSLSPAKLPALDHLADAATMRIGIRTELERLSHYMPGLLRYEKKMTHGDENIHMSITGNKTVDTAFIKNVQNIEKLKLAALSFRAKASTVAPSLEQQQLLQQASLAEQQINVLKDQNHLAFWDFLSKYRY